MASSEEPKKEPGPPSITEEKLQENEPPVEQDKKKREYKEFEGEEREGTRECPSLLIIFTSSTLSSSRFIRWKHRFTSYTSST